ncbi:uncharacterized protein EV420DRAFT_1222370, partial [Desarmillaria tabescens]
MLHNSNLQGIHIPGSVNNLITKLFADDTTVYLSETDSFNTLQIILNKWCLASRAKFNISKTECVPIGTKEFRETFYKSRQLNSFDSKIPQNIHIVQDGEAVRSLGCWIGNHIKDATPWTSIIEKIDNSLVQWNKSHPTLEGHSYIIQLVIGNGTQFLTKVQGMPNHIEAILIKKIQNFMWNSTGSPPVSLETLYKPKDQGGKQLLDLHSRNKAITLMTL